MKKIFYSFMLLSVLLSFVSCKDMDGTYEEYIVPNGRVYPGVAKNPVVYAGKNRVQLQWLKGKDPTTVRAEVYWNNYTNVFKVNYSDYEGDTIRCIIPDLAENSYSFVIRSFNEAGDISVPTEVIGWARGENYQAILTNRDFDDASLEDGNLVVAWGLADLYNGAIATEIEYTNTNDEIVNVWNPIKTNADTITYENYKIGSEFKYRTAFVSDSLVVDTFYTSWVSNPGVAKIPVTNWTITASTTAGGAYVAESAIDNDYKTYWHSKISPLPTAYPHWLAIDMKESYKLGHLELIRPQDAANSTIYDFILQYSQDGTVWTDIQSYRMEDVDGVQSFDIPANAGETRYFRIYAVNGKDSKKAALAEIAVFLAVE
ncbi:DUF4998 domain-containing protein [Bacteroides sp.]|uniref:DUF4998 domain-containing protein n=1 Tax=Bacteroides sp. TaxID=29523 RepID=UPI0025C6F2F7|nr:DUF4998 domain-containing protein [Bacteroides sp.]